MASSRGLGFSEPSLVSGCQANRLRSQRLRFPASRRALETVLVDNRFYGTPACQELGVLPRPR